MNHEPVQDELLSAFLDGELGAADRARVERSISESAAAQKSLAEMQRLRVGLAQLPKYTLPDDFPTAVMHAAEQRLRESAPTRARTKPERTHARDGKSPGSPLAMRFDWDRWRRPLVWSAAAIALALILNNYNSEPTAPPAISQGPDGSGDQGAFVSKDLTSPPSIDGLQTPPMDSSRLVGPPVVGPPMVGPATGGLLVVKSLVTPSAARSRVFRKLLMEQQIAWSVRAAAQVGPVRVESGLGRPSTASAPDPAHDSTDHSPPSLELIYVEASPAQISAMLAAISKQADAFLTLAVEPVPGIPVQSFWKNEFSRGRPVHAATPGNDLQAGTNPANGNAPRTPLVPPSLLSAPLQPVSPIPAAHAERIEIPHSTAAFSPPKPEVSGKMIRMEERPAVTSTGPATTAPPALQRVLFIFSLEPPADRE